MFKDDFGYKSFDLVTWITDVDDDNGPFHTIKKNTVLKNLFAIQSRVFVKIIVWLKINKRSCFKKNKNIYFLEGTAQKQL